jgi:hypothetical protein
MPISSCADSLSSIAQCPASGNQNSSDRTSSTQTALIAAPAAVGALILLVVVIAVVVTLSRRFKKTRVEESDPAEPRRIADAATVTLISDAPAQVKICIVA